MSTSGDLSLARFWAPRYWPTWLLWAAMRLVARLPTAWQQTIGVHLGRWLGRLPLRQVRTARRNLELCFPKLPASERAALVARHLEAVGLSFVDMAIGWFMMPPPKDHSSHLPPPSIEDLDWKPSSPGRSSATNISQEWRPAMVRLV